MAITGDVGAGKSTVSQLLESRGGFLIDADRVVGELWQTPEMTEAAVGRWGREVLDAAGKILHKAIAARIFEDRAEYNWVTGLLHPLVHRETKRRIDLAFDDKNRNNPWVVVEIPLLFEAGVAPWVTAKVFVTASRKTRLQLCRTRGWDEAEMTRRESFFLPSENRMALSDYVVYNDGNIEELQDAVEKIYAEKIYRNAAAPAPTESVAEEG
jgi:dephospho-CoA kinase